MRASLAKRLRSLVTWPMVLAACLASVGCKTVKLQNDDNFSDDLATWGEDHRPADSTDGNLTGASEKARQVERNLGMR
jgi:hypothetical protein